MAININFHIGIVKCMSTHFQSHLAKLDDLKQIIYIGARENKKNKYKNKLESKLLNLDLRFSNNISFENNLKYYVDFFSKKMKYKKEIWISSENISTKFIPNDLIFEEKINRINRIFKKNKIKYFIFYRNIYDLIKSIYYEYRYQGYSDNFNFFCDYLMADMNSNFLFDLSPSYKNYQLKKLKKKDDKIEFLFVDDSNIYKEIKDKCNLTIYSSNKINSKEDRSYNKLNNSYIGIENSGLQEIHKTFYHQSDNKFKDIKIKRHLKRDGVKFKEIEIKSNSKNFDLLVKKIKVIDKIYFKKNKLEDFQFNNFWKKK